MALIKRSVSIAGHASSITLEPEFLSALENIAKTQKKSFNEIVTEIDENRGDYNLSSAIRVYILKHVQTV